MPVSNVIRSTGDAGTITVKVFSEGLKTGEIKIIAEKSPIISVGIDEPVLNPKDRLPVKHNPKVTNNYKITTK